MVIKVILFQKIYIFIHNQYSEYYANCVPDKVLVTGKGLVKNIKEFCELVNVDVAPGFRFRKVHDDYQIKKRIMNFQF